MSNSRQLYFALRLLRWICPDHLYEEIEGDLIQKFNRDVKNFGERGAKRRMVWNAVRFCRPGILLRNKFSIELNQFSMIMNCFKISLRSLLKNKVFAIINVSGLAISMAAFFMIVHYVKFERSYENFNANANDVYRITLEIYKGDEYVITDCEMYAPIGQILTQEFPEVLDFARMYSYDGYKEVRVDEKVFHEDLVYFADPSAFNIFATKVLRGNPESALSGPFQAAIAESMAIKYYGRTDIIGESIEIGKSLYKVTAVLEDTPPNTHLKVNFLLAHVTLAKLWNYKEMEFGGNNEYTYLLMNKGVDLAAFNLKLKKLSGDMMDKIGDDRLIADRMKDIHLYSNKSYEPEANGNAQAVYFLLIIAVFILVIAWINYINLSTARAVDRAKEVGIRKVMGSMRTQLVFQFLSEATIVCLVGATLALLIVYIGLPLFIQLTGQALPLALFLDREFWYLTICIFISGSLVSGIYPAFVLSSFKPVAVLKGKFRSTSHGQWLRRGLVIFQFTSTVLLIVCVCTVYFQLDHLQNHKLGMNIEQILVLRSPKTETDSLYSANYQSFKSELLMHSSIKKVTKSGVVPGLSLQELSTTGNVFRVGQPKKDKGYIYYINSFDEDFISTLQMKLLAGSNFKDGPSAVDQLIINEEAVYSLGFKSADEAIGSKLSFYDQEKTIIGVLDNFYFRSPKEKHLPMVFWCDSYADYFSLRIGTERVPEVMAEVKESWRKVFSDIPFDYFFLDEKYNQQYKPDRQFGHVMAVFGALAAFIACLGLFGLSSFTIIQRTKEIGIRKVLGATAAQIAQLLSRDFVKQILIAAIIAFPLAYFAMDKWLSNYATRITMNIWIFLVPLLAVLLIAFLTVGFQTAKAANSNPVNALGSE